MIDQANVATKLKKRFGHVVEVRPGILRTSEKFENQEYAVRYFDLTGNLGQAASRLREYQEDLMTQTFFDKSSPTHLRWNHYLYFVAADEPTKAFQDAKEHVEADRTYARKSVLSEKELFALLASETRNPTPRPTDVASQWANRLKSLDLSFILDDSITAPEAARHIKAGRTRTPTGPAAPQALSEAEQVAKSGFLQSLNITGFRKHPLPRDFAFGRVNLIFGRNGTGKTSLLEAIEYLYCGANRRNEDILPGTKLTGTFAGSTEHLTTSPSTRLANLRSRNAHWYAKADVKKPTLADSFGKFNFLDTDAAVDLSNNNDSDDRLKGDVSRLVLGAEVEKLTSKLVRVGEKIDQSIRDTEKDRCEAKRRVTEAKLRLEAVRKAPKTSDAIYVDLRGSLAKLGWRTVPGTKDAAPELSDSLQSAAVAARQLSRAAKADKTADAADLLQRRSVLEGALTKAEELSEQITNNTLQHATARHFDASLRSRQSSVEALMRYASTKLIEKSSLRKELLLQNQRMGARLAALGTAVAGLTDVLKPNSSLLEVASIAERVINEHDTAIKEQTDAIKTIETTMATVSILKQRLLSTATELLAKVSNPDHCPVCQTQFEAGELELRMTLAIEDGGSDSLAEAQTNLTEETEKRDRAATVHAAITALLTFVGPKTDLTVKQAFTAVENAKTTLDQDQRELQEVESALEQLTREGLSESDLTDRLAVEPPRLSRRLQLLRGWSHEEDEQVFPGSPRAGGSDGAGAPARARFAMGGDRFDRDQDRLHGADAMQLGTSDRA